MLEKDQVSLPNEIQQKFKILPAKMKKMYGMMISKIQDAEKEIEEIDWFNKNESHLEIVDLKCKKVKGFLTSVIKHLKDYLEKYGLSTPKLVKKNSKTLWKNVQTLKFCLYFSSIIFF